VSRALGLDAAELRHPRGRRRLGQLPWEQVVPGIATGDVDDVAAQADLLDVLQEDDVHHCET